MSQICDKPIQSGEGSRPKKLYSKPELIWHGTSAELTSTVTGSVEDDGSSMKRSIE